jgi:UPF0755 protein
MNDIQPRRKRPQESVSVGKQAQLNDFDKSQFAEVISSDFDVSHVLSSVNLQPEGGEKVPKKAPLKKWILYVLLGIALVVSIAVAAVYVWYRDGLKPVDTSDSTTQRVVIESGMGLNSISHLLDQKNLIKNATVFEWYVRFRNVQDALQAGTFSLSRSMSLSEIVDHLRNGKTDTVTLTFYPGATLRDTSSTVESKKTDVKTVLLRAGYDEGEIEAALRKQYTHPLLASKPLSADIEGYVFGETYKFPSSATVEQILMRTFDEMYSVVKENDLEAAFETQGLTLHKGIILASIVQREVPTPIDQAAVARVFYNRISAGMNLGSDVTYQYIADKTGVPRDPGLESPYNTRIHTGLTPGPIAAPGKSALLAVAHPATNGYLFFLSGDDDKTYFATTQAEHEQNIVNYCQQKCQIL